MKKITAAAVAAIATIGIAGPAAAIEAEAGPANEQARSCVLKGGIEFSSVGHMMQYLRDRDGNPKATVDLYPNHFESVGDLVSIKCA